MPPVGLAPPLASAAILGGLLGTLALPGLLGGLALALLMALAVRRYRLALLIAVLAVSAGQVLLARGSQLPQGLSRADLTTQVRILSFSDEGRFMRLRLAVEACRPRESERPSCAALDQVRVSWYDPPALAVNDRWRLTLRLRPSAGFANPDSFDYGAWLWREGIDATGYVRDAPPPQRLAVGRPGVRQTALGYLDRHVDDPLARRWLAALTLGAAERLDSADWELLNATGTTHVMVVSGLHVGLVAALMLGLTRGLARLVTPRRWRLATWPWWCAAAAAIGYAWLAGLEPPALRAMIMTLIGLWVASGRHAPGPWQGWWLALAVIVLLDPLALWRPGLWLSFVAVGLLIVIWQGRTRPSGGRGWLLALLRTQGLLAPLMAAAVLLAFDRLAPAAPLVNLLIVPVVGSLMVPLGLAGWLLAWVPPLAEGLWQLFALLAHALQALLVWGESVMPLWQPPAWQAWPLALGLVLLTALWALPGVARTPRWVGSAALLLMAMTLTPPNITTGTLQVRVNDVGQGQLLELRTANHRLLYDTGPRFRSGFMPLETLWPPGQAFDAVIVSHSDRDHAGGMAALRELHDVGRWYSPGVVGLGVDDRACRAGSRWRWDGVEFRFLGPPAGADLAGRESNDRSCVLLVEAGDQRLLVSGDASAEVERRLAEALPGPVSVLVAGHHGSRSSSSPSWVAASRPSHVVFSAGRDNPLGHPAASVVRRFRAAGSCLWNTATDGAVTFRLGGQSAHPVAVEREPAGWRGGVDGRCHAVESPYRDAFAQE
ncbi:MULTISPECIES: DNA internalization-related competence protein ComEC/Rec2 [Halomonadaceae]|uniref:DNA internalization-related competence protein ComEC/Rec2 n=1 Tax=Modicisalibacter zincidurans TaxID=1178777 RepID=A0ABP9QZE1_9GAMM|nr:MULTISPECIES: DNA internalization-related competence protein ComEC/Rec2 [Halomonas]MCD6007654.1 DNA internalization-related competence protein ComEC/Rec2 [Halomonas sp. IOP_31]